MTQKIKTTDRELLELAAKAARIQIGCRGCGKLGCVGECEWNPLTDDSDALRLAVKLKMQLDCELGCARTIIWFDGDDREGGVESKLRLAIVRAAAAIGKESK